MNYRDLNQAEGNRKELSKEFTFETHTILSEGYYCFDYHMKESPIHFVDVGLHVIYRRTEDGEIEFFVWCYIQNIPLLRQIGHEWLPCEDYHPRAVFKLVVDAIFDSELILAAFEASIHRIFDIGRPEKATMIFRGCDGAFNDSVEFTLPECIFERDDIRLHIVYDTKDREVVRYSA